MNRNQSVRCVRRNSECISPRDSKQIRPQISNSPLSQWSPPHEDDSPRGPEFTLTDMRLFHHFLLHTSKSFTEEDIGTGELWTDVVPSLASDHDFLMRGILAIAAFQYVCHDPCWCYRTSRLHTTLELRLISDINPPMNLLLEFERFRHMLILCPLLQYGIPQPERTEELSSYCHPASRPCTLIISNRAH